jgi:hypothetical protein
MAVDKFESQIQHSLYGRRFGFDGNGFAVGTPGVRIPVESLSAASTMAGTGLTVLTGSTATFTLAAPAAVGIEKIILNASTLSTAVMTVIRSTASGACAFLGSTANGDATGTTLTLQANGASVRLVGITTGVWAPIGNVGNITSSGKIMNITTAAT